jgi:hypothetical protein
MQDIKSTNPQGELVIYETSNKEIKLEVRMENETIWLSQKQIALLFDKDVRTINDHIINIYKEQELEQNPTIRNFRIVQKEGNRDVERDIEHYNLDVIISVGYRVSSLRGTQFRIWATKTLKDLLLKGYVLNEQKLLETQNKFQETFFESNKLIKSYMKD